ncbi:diacylglycerol/lipid kinase family protein [Sediminispirochaeta bajacaliforniensis]|uniref:diacylglycerol/lipid kinase family protein n=1 Tax=Sediminispirochaeta bajacaliforniensis TaxID=148 RepID=UPI0003623D70|nr:diacylglycerol kinase family protein [Sediminispirochaeta bajacaliforniensis]
MNAIKDGNFAECELVINPSRYPQYAKLLRKILRHSNFARIIESESRDHFIRCIREFRQGDRRYLLVWGGDGTAHDTINTLVDRSEQLCSDNAPRNDAQAFGFLRGGSGNGIQDSYEVPFRLKHQLMTYAESVANDYVEPVDLLSVTSFESGQEHVEYGQLVGLGFDAKVLEYRNQKIRRSGKQAGHPRPGLLNYFRAALQTFGEGFDERPLNIMLSDGKYAFRGYRVNAEFPFDHLERKTPVPMLEVGTRPYYGKLFKVCPDVVCNDGKIDLYLFNFQDHLSIVKNSILLWKGEHDKINKKLIKKGKPVIERYEVSSVLIRGSYPFRYHIDGELKNAGPDPTGDGYSIKVTVCPKAMRFLVPGTFYRKFHPDFSE